MRFEDKIAVIGRDFNTNVKGVKAALEKKLGKEVELFEPSEAASKAWEKLKVDYKGHVPDEIAKRSLMYKENLDWAQKIKKNGYTVKDAGLGTQVEKGTFYEMETKTIFGDK